MAGKPATEGKIRILDKNTVNQIAAGEVVERPASLVKELAENAIDAGATMIRIEIGTTERMITGIRVVDDGTGMVGEDARLAFTRHATSKIGRIADLEHLATMGFRGEALASIAAVSRVTLITKDRSPGTLAGTRIAIEGGILLEEGETGAPAGTDIAIRDLFYNVPARKKFQKSLSTELAHIYRIVERMALAHRNISFYLLLNGGEKLSTPGSGSWRDVIGALYGVRLIEDLIPIRADTSLVSINGYIAKPSASRPNPDQVAISINNRQITSLLLSRAVKSGYGTLLAKDRFPVAFINLSIDPGLVDVNVHPTKREVRLRDEHQISTAITRTVSETLASADLIFPVRAEETLPKTRGRAADGFGRFRSLQVKSPPSTYSAHRSRSQTDRQLRVTEPISPSQPGTSSSLPPLDVVGQLAATFILATGSGGEELYIIDQHAAHERILYDQIRARRDRNVESQELLVPVVLTLNPKEAAMVHDSLHLLMQEGFILEEFGSGTYAVRTVPVVLGKQPRSDLIHDIISDLMADEKRSADLNRETITAIVACRSAIKANTPLSREQMERLISQLGETELPYTCPHGRPTIITLSRAKLESLFLRT